MSERIEGVLMIDIDPVGVRTAAMAHIKVMS